MAPSKLNRRRFLRNSSLGILAAGTLGNHIVGSPAGISQMKEIKGYREFGRTGFKVSDISCGSIREENIVRALLDRGVNLLETSESYNNGNHERTLARIIKDYDRSKLFIVTKIHYNTGPMDSKSEIIKRCNASLERLGTDYIDGYMIHSALSTEAVRNRHFHSAIKELKNEGKVRFTGVSCHGSSYFDNPEESMEQILGAAIDDGRFDFVEMIYNFFEPDMGARILDKCAENNIGTMIMKSNPVYIFEVVKDIVEKAKEEGAQVSERRLQYYEKYGKQAETAQKFFADFGIEGAEKIRKAALQFVLSNKNVHTIPTAIATMDDINMHLGVSGTTLEATASADLKEFDRITGFMNCRIGCDICESSCPYNMPVNTILRYNYYYMAKKKEKYAMKLYTELPGEKPDLCTDCEAYCENACPHGVMARGLLAMAHKNLSFDIPNLG